MTALSVLLALMVYVPAVVLMGACAAGVER